MKKDPKYRIFPHTYIFGGKSAPSYYLAKKIIYDMKVNSKMIFVRN